MILPPPGQTSTTVLPVDEDLPIVVKGIEIKTFISLCQYFLCLCWNCKDDIGGFIKMCEPRECCKSGMSWSKVDFTGINIR